MCTLNVLRQVILMCAIILIILHNGMAKQNYDVRFEGAKMLTEPITKYSQVNVLNVHKYNRSTYILDFEALTTVLLNNSFTLAMELHHSVRGNNQFRKYPADVIGEQPLCDWFENVYRIYFYEQIAPFTNLPSLNKDTNKMDCPMKPDLYYVRKYAVTDENLPSFLPDGMWRVHIIATINKVTIFTLEITSVIERRELKFST